MILISYFFEFASSDYFILKLNNFENNIFYSRVNPSEKLANQD